MGAILAPLIDCHAPDRTVSGEQNMHSGSFNNAEQFSIDVSFNTFYNTAKTKCNKLIFDLFTARAISRNGRCIFNMPLDFYRLA